MGSILFALRYANINLAFSLHSKSRRTSNEKIYSNIWLLLSMVKNPFVFSSDTLLNHFIKLVKEVQDPQPNGNESNYLI